MNTIAGPWELAGTVRTTGDRLMIEVDKEPTRDRMLSDGSKVQMLVWAESSGVGPNEIDRIAEQQQLDRSTVAQALVSEGALFSERVEFLKRLSLIEM